ncbi:MAG: hypothetical protein HY820_09400 [Acidobacteria bacterium]|nr:hypothetical protein [Acidobacteriota bacterium]
MTITIASELEEQVRKRAQAEGLTVQAFVERLIREEDGWVEHVEGPLGESDPEFAEVNAAVREGLAQAERGEARSAQEVFAGLRAKHGISR